MSWIYPRTVSITRTAAPAGLGAQAYSGRQKATETPVAGPTPASIQQNRTSKDPLGELPADAEGRGNWAIFCPQLALSIAVMEGDIVTDDAGKRYNVTLPYWNGFGYKLICETLKS